MNRTARGDGDGDDAADAAAGAIAAQRDQAGRKAAIAAAAANRLGKDAGGESAVRDKPGVVGSDQDAPPGPAAAAFAANREYADRTTAIAAAAANRLGKDRVRGNTAHRTVLHDVGVVIDGDLHAVAGCAAATAEAQSSNGKTAVAAAAPNRLRE